MPAEKSVTAFPEIREPLLNTLGGPGRNTRLIPAGCGGPDIPADLAAYINQDQPAIPDVAEIETVRHFTRLSRLNFGVEHGMYPLGSCTMKYNPKICEESAAKIKNIHPADTSAMRQVLEALHCLQTYLLEICGLDACCLWPAAGAHGELTGMLVIHRALQARGQTGRNVVLIPDTAHGTNPASCTIAGFTTRAIPSGAQGYLEAATLEKFLDDDVAALMITNPNTLGIFEQDIAKIAGLLHKHGAFLYMDGANLNALLGLVRPGDIGVDCLHVNLHKTFATPHGGGGPGSGPVLVTQELEPFLPAPRIVCEQDQRYFLDYNLPQSIGRVHATLGNTGVLMRALSYILSIGASGLRDASLTATLNANYLKTRLSADFDLPYTAQTLHEFVLSDARQKDMGVTTLDIAKALMDHGFHPPTIYFPLVVHGAIMVEPTETEPLEELDRFVHAMTTIAQCCRENPENLHNQPQSTPVSRVDEVKAARNLILTWPKPESREEDRVSK